MEYTYATLLLEESGSELSETNITAVLEAAGADVEESRTKAFVAALEGVDVEDTATTDGPDEAVERDPAAPTDDGRGDATDHAADGAAEEEETVEGRDEDADDGPDVVSDATEGSGSGGSETAEADGGRLDFEPKDGGDGMTFLTSARDADDVERDDTAVGGAREANPDGTGDR